MSYSRAPLLLILAISEVSVLNISITSEFKEDIKRNVDEAYTIVL